MSTKKTLSVEELTKAYEEAEANFKTLGEQLKAAQKEEEDRKKAELALQQEKRHKEIEDASKHLNELCKAYVEDYGHLKLESNSEDDDWFPSFWKHNFWF